MMSVSDDEAQKTQHFQIIKY